MSEETKKNQPVAPKSNELEELKAKNKGLSDENESLQAKLTSFAEKIKAQEAELVAMRDAKDNAEKESAIADVEEALRAKVIPAKHDEQREKWMKMRLRDGAEDFREFIEMLPDLPHTKQLIGDAGSTADGKYGLNKALEKSLEEASLETREGAA